MDGEATYRKPTDEEWKHIVYQHIGIQISTADGAATVSIIGDCTDPHCTHVFSCKYCKRPPC
jgi:hypothetical protein